MYMLLIIDFLKAHFKTYLIPILLNLGGIDTVFTTLNL